jgi:hypothetical protein
MYIYNIYILITFIVSTVDLPLASSLLVPLVHGQASSRSVFDASQLVEVALGHLGYLSQSRKAPRRLQRSLKFKGVPSKNADILVFEREMPKKSVGFL